MAAAARSDAGAAHCVWPTRAVLGEGPVYDRRDDAIYFVDIKGRRLHRHALADKAQSTWHTPEPICWLLPRATEPGFIAGFKSGFAKLTLDPFVIDRIGAPDPERETNRLNDAKVDSTGRIWAGSMDDDEQRVSGALYRLDPSLEWSRMDDGYGVANGPAFSPAGDVLYHADSARRVVYCFALSPEGLLSDRREFVRFADDWGYPDGMTTDSEGCIWIAHWDGARVSRFTPDGELDRAHALPVSRPTSCVFAGARLDRLFVTSASIGREEEPLAGALFELDPGVRGAPSFAFAG